MNKINDFTLLKMCAEFGGRARYWRQKFIGLLPEVNKRRLYEKKKCGSIFEFAYKFAGLSEKQVRLAINLEERFYDKPELYTALVNGDVSIHKLTKIASIATKENAAELVEKTKILPCHALETFARDLKNPPACDSGNSANGTRKIENGLPEPLFGPKSLHVQKLEFEFSDEIVEELNQLNRQGQNMDKIMKELLEYRKQRIQEEKQEISAQVEPTDSRYINAATRHILKEEFGTKCSVPGCNKPAAGIHHTLPFAVTHMHDPQFMVPLCKEHHQITHLVNLKYAEKLKQ
jgi:hypothetical protein